MIISPPFLAPCDDSATDTDPLMTLMEQRVSPDHGIYPFTLDRRWHGGTHLIAENRNDPVRAIADGEVIAYRISQYMISECPTEGESATDAAPDTNDGFVLLRHVTDTGEGRTITFYSLYMHLMDLNTLTLTNPPPPPPEETSPTDLSAWLLQATEGVSAGEGKKVYRKDILGYTGQCHGSRHLHFEIFMTEGDFTAWFDQPDNQVQLGIPNPSQPSTSDYWGHTYHVLPGHTGLQAHPDGERENELFPQIEHGVLPPTSKLYVESYFHLGQRYMRSWLDENGDGNLVQLTKEPVRDPSPDYEYNLYKRATALYPQRASDGYELLRFGGRILTPIAPTTTSYVTWAANEYTHTNFESLDLTSYHYDPLEFRTLINNQPNTPPPVNSQDNSTWIAVPFTAPADDNEGSGLGYVNVGQESIIKLSDADFPYFMGWRKIDQSNAPLNDEGFISYPLLRQLVSAPQAQEYEVPESDPAFTKDEQLAFYLQRNEIVRNTLSRWICNLPSEWDSVNNDALYSDLNHRDAYFGCRKDEDPNGYENFIAFKKKLQFLDQVPSLNGGQNFWHFHPMAFIRHFRKCGWLSTNEILQLIPQNVIRKPGAHNSNREGVWEQPNVRFAKSLMSTHGQSLNKSLRKFVISTPLRQACFIANSTQETAWFRYLTEGNRRDDSMDLHQGWFGRGFLQLTNPNGNLNGGNNNYYKYFRFLGRRPVTPPTQQEFRWKNEIGRDAFHASHSAGAYWVWPNKSAPTSRHPERPQVDSANRYSDVRSRNSRRIIQTNAGDKVWYFNQSFSNSATAVNYPGATGQVSPNMNGLIDRSTSFTNALIVLDDTPIFEGPDGTDAHWPEDYVRRKS